MPSVSLLQIQLLLFTDPNQLSCLNGTGKLKLVYRMQLKGRLALVWNAAEVNVYESRLYYLC